MKFCIYLHMTTALPSPTAQWDQWVSHWRTSCNHAHQQLIYHVSMLHVFFKTRVCQTIYHSTFWKRTISPWSIRLGSDSSISPWSVGCRVCPPRHGLHLRALVACTNEVWSANPYLLHILSVLQLTTTMLLPVRTMHYRRLQKQDCWQPASTYVSAILFTMAHDYVITSQNGCPAFARAGAGAGFSNGNQHSLSA